MALLHFFNIVAVKAPNPNLFIRKTKRAIPIQFCEAKNGPKGLHELYIKIGDTGLIA